MAAARTTGEGGAALLGLLVGLADNLHRPERHVGRDGREPGGVLHDDGLGAGREGCLTTTDSSTDDPAGAFVLVGVDRAERRVVDLLQIVENRTAELPDALHVEDGTMSQADEVGAAVVYLVV